jgi:two-component system, NarL family, response regulator NreC
MGKILIVAEQSDVIRKGIIQIIDGFGLFEKIHEATGFTKLQQAIIRFNPDILLVNPALIHEDIMAWLGGLENKKMKTAAIVYSNSEDEMTHDFDEVIIIEDTRLNIKNKISGLLNNPPARKTRDHDNSLSSREKDVVRLLAKGFSNKEISEKLFISPHTTLTHRKNITRKLNIKSVAGLIVYAIINDIVSVDEMQEG